MTKRDNDNLYMEAVQSNKFTSNNSMSDVAQDLLKSLPVCDVCDNGEDWQRGMVLSDAIAFKNTWFWRVGDPWLGNINALINDLAIPSDWVVWRGDDRALIRIGNVVSALTYVQDSRYETFALAWPSYSQAAFINCV